MQSQHSHMLRDVAVASDHVQQRRQQPADEAIPLLPVTAHRPSNSFAAAFPRPRPTLSPSRPITSLAHDAPSAAAPSSSTYTSGHSNSLLPQAEVSSSNLTSKSDGHLRPNVYSSLTPAAYSAWSSSSSPSPVEASQCGQNQRFHSALSFGQADYTNNHAHLHQYNHPPQQHVQNSRQPIFGPQQARLRSVVPTITTTDLSPHQAPQDSTHHSAISDSSASSYLYHGQTPSTAAAEHFPEFSDHFLSDYSAMAAQVLAAPSDSLHAPVSPISANSPHEQHQQHQPQMAESLPRKRSHSQMSHEIQLPDDLQPNGRQSRATSNASNRQNSASPGPDDYSPKGSKSFKRPDPPTNEIGKYICTFSDECNDLIFDRKCEWRYVNRSSLPTT